MFEENNSCSLGPVGLALDGVQREGARIGPLDGMTVRTGRDAGDGGTEGFRAREGPDQLVVAEGGRAGERTRSELVIRPGECSRIAQGPTRSSASSVGAVSSGSQGLRVLARRVRRTIVGRAAGAGAASASGDCCRPCAGPSVRQIAAWRAADPSVELPRR